jgi:hypothetical protein
MPGGKNGKKIGKKLSTAPTAVGEKQKSQNRLSGRPLHRRRAIGAREENRLLV